MKQMFLTLTILSTLLATGCGSRSDSEPQPQRTVDATTKPDEFLTFLNHDQEINTQQYADSYYAHVDPANERTTLADWKQTVGFDASSAVHATFRDTKDLGYGRDMFAWQDSDGNAYFFVDNYLVELEPGDATDYGPLNLAAAIEQDRRYQIGTNVIEFSEDPSNPSKKIAKFFTFAAPDSAGIQRRLTRANLDGRGVKFMPGMCLACHGGELYPLAGDGSFHPISLKSPKPHILEEDSLEFSDRAGFTKASQKDNIKAINSMVFDSYKTLGEYADDESASPADLANWDSSFAEQLIELAYGDSSPGDHVLELNTDYKKAVPSGWKQNGVRPDGVETLYLQVVEPHCIGCHSLRGTQAATNSDSPLANAVNLNSWESFHAYNDKIIDLVYRQGSMPRSLINYSQFWQDPSGLPTLLASFLDNFDVVDSNGQVMEPGRAVAVPGVDRSLRSPAILDASASHFTASYSWRLLSPLDGSASLDDVNSSAPVLTAADGPVELELVTANANGSSEPVNLTITVDSGLSPAPEGLTFDNVIALFNTRHSQGYECVECHAPNNGLGLVVPVYYSLDSYLDKPSFYREILRLVNLDDPESSRLLTKPTSPDYHGGGLQLDLTDTADRSAFNLLLNWIRQGAPLE